MDPGPCMLITKIPSFACASKLTPTETNGTSAYICHEAHGAHRTSSEDGTKVNNTRPG